MSKTTEAAIDHENLMREREDCMNAFTDWVEEQAARRWFTKNPERGLKLVLEIAQEHNNKDVH